MILHQKAGQRRYDEHGGQKIWTAFETAPGGVSGPGFRTLESYREERLDPGAGFKMVVEHDLEVLTTVVEGAVILEETVGRTVVLEAGEFHRTSVRAGSQLRGYNGSLSDPARVIQCLVTTDRSVLHTPAEKKRFPVADRRGLLRLVSSRSGSHSSLRIRQDAGIYSAILDTGHHLIHELAPGRSGWLSVLEGSIQVGDAVLGKGDAMSFVDENAVTLTARNRSEILLFDLR